MDSIKLKPCPFCGSRAEFGQVPAITHAARFFVTCPSCGVETPRTARRKDLAAAVWNRRAARELTAAPTARWVVSADGVYIYCSRCRERPERGKLTDFCPGCGARMNGGLPR